MATIAPIDRIPTTPKPPAVPSLWNNIFDQIDDRLQRLNDGKLEGTKKIDGGSGTGGVPVLFETVFTELPGLSATAIDGYILGIAAITKTGFTINAREVDGNLAPLAFRWTAVGK